MDSASQILDIAERRIRCSGYNAVSYRDIAAEMGIKSASLHYHFPKKEDLGVSLVKRYADRFQSELKTRTVGEISAKDKLTCFVELYRDALKQNGLICLCAVLGAESAGLPAMITAEVKSFFDMNIAWLTELYSELGHEAGEVKAKTTVALLEGAMIISVVNEDYSVFEAAAVSILESL